MRDRCSHRTNVVKWNEKWNEKVCLPTCVARLMIAKYVETRPDRSAGLPSMAGLHKFAVGTRKANTLSMTLAVAEPQQADDGGSCRQIWELDEDEDFWISRMRARSQNCWECEGRAAHGKQAGEMEGKVRWDGCKNLKCGFKQDANKYVRLWITEAGMLSESNRLLNRMRCK